MGEGLPVIYACFYTYDEAAHAFGPTDPTTLTVLRHIDNTIRLAAQKGTGSYEIVVLSDHGQVESTPFVAIAGTTLGRFLSEWLPGHRITEHRGGVFGPPTGNRVEITYSGGLAHVFFREFPYRLDHGQVEASFPGLIGKLASLDEIGIVMSAGMLTTNAGDFPLSDPLSSQTAELLARFDEPHVLAQQLRRLNSFQRAGDLVLFGAYDGDKQVNFKAQVGGHGSIGGDQLHPFVLAKRDWRFDTSAITNASELHPLLVGLRDRGLRSAEDSHLLPQGEAVGDEPRLDYSPVDKAVDADLVE